jgi:hypothetical protein
MIWPENELVCSPNRSPAKVQMPPTSRALATLGVCRTGIDPAQKCLMYRDLSFPRCHHDI